MDRLQALRAIDKFDKIGRSGVVELLQKPADEFGADAMRFQAEALGMLLDCRGVDNGETLANLKRLTGHLAATRNRLDMMVLLEETHHPEGETGWDRLLQMRRNADQTWSDGGRPSDMAIALDDLVAVVTKGGAA